MRGPASEAEAVGEREERLSHSFCSRPRPREKAIMGPKNELAGVDCSEKRDSENLEADGQINADQPAVANPVAQVAPNDQADVGDKESSVNLSVSDDDRTILTAAIDRTASQKRILDDLARALPQFAVPHREIDRRIAEAIRLKLDENMTFEDASIYVFGTSDHARKIRYWRNRWGIR
jgi:hypothetical protein